LYVNANDAPAINRVRPIYTPAGTARLAPVEAGRFIYEATCMACHRSGREGVPPVIPTLVNVLDRTPADEVRTVISQGRNSMPAFPQFKTAELNALVEFLRTAPDEAQAGEPDPAPSATPERYASEGTRLFVDQDGYPASAPPWGTLNAIDLGSGEVLWQVPL